MVELVVLGSVCLDTIATPSGKIKNALGGSSIYAAIAASNFVKPGVLGIVGGDFPSEYEDILANRGIDLEGLEIRPDAETFRWEADYCADASNPKAIERKNACLNDAPIIPDSYRGTGYLLLANQEPGAQMKVIDAMMADFTMADTMNVYIQSNPAALQKVISNVDVFICNQNEARLYWDGEKSLLKAARGFLAMGPRAVIIKTGEHGAHLFARNGHFAVPAVPMDEITDPTGAGDSFAGAFMAWLAKTDDTSYANMKKAMVVGSATASFTVQGWGTSVLQSVGCGRILERYNDIQDMMSF